MNPHLPVNKSLHLQPLERQQKDTRTRKAKDASTNSESAHKWTAKGDSKSDASLVATHKSTVKKNKKSVVPLVATQKSTVKKN